MRHYVEQGIATICHYAEIARMDKSNCPEHLQMIMRNYTD